MSRVFFPTTSMNRFGVRETDQRATLSGVSRFPAEPTPRSAMTPTGPLLGSVDDGLGFVRAVVGDGVDYPAGMNVGLMRMYGLPVPAPVRAPVAPIRIVSEAPALASNLVPAGTFTYQPPISSSGGGGAVAQPAPPPAAVAAVAAIPVSQQVGPTPTATLPAPPANNAILVSSGGGTQTPATSAAATAAPTSTGTLVDGIAAWLGGSTSLMNYNVPNALLAGVVVLGFAWLSSGSSGKKR